MPAPYELVLFDCFNTLFLVDESRMPMIELDGRPTPSTAGCLLEHLRPLAPELDGETLHRAHREAWRWAESQRGEAVREVPAVVRFGRMAELLGLPALAEAETERLVAVHIAAVTRSYVLPVGHRRLLQRLRGRMGVALFSNFDYGPGLRDLLRREGIEPWFDPLVISAEIGYRKPGRAAFDHALEAAGTDPARVLLVGDSPGDDVAGAHAAGLDVAWLNRGTDAPTPEPAPTYTLTDLEQVEPLLG